MGRERLSWSILNPFIPAGGGYWGQSSAAKSEEEWLQSSSTSSGLFLNTQGLSQNGALAVREPASSRPFFSEKESEGFVLSWSPSRG